MMTKGRGRSSSMGSIASGCRTTTWSAAGLSWFGRPLKEVEDDVLKDPSAASRTAFSPDRDQQFLHVLDRRHQRALILDRKTRETLGAFGGGLATAPRQFYVLHDLASDSRANV